MTVDALCRTVLRIDLAGYASFVSCDSIANLVDVETMMSVARNVIFKYGGAIHSRAGDSFLATFNHVPEAVSAAMELQDPALEGFDRRLRFRVGIHTGLVYRLGQEIAGNAVNIAARLEALSDPGGMAISQEAFDHVQQAYRSLFRMVGSVRLKHIDRPVVVLKFTPDATQALDNEHPSSQGAFLSECKILLGVKPPFVFGASQEDESAVSCAMEEIILGLEGHGYLDVVDFRELSAPQVAKRYADEIDSALAVSFRRHSRECQIVFTLVDPGSGRVLKSLSRRFDGIEEPVRLAEEMTVFACQSVDVIHNAIFMERSKAGHADTLFLAVHRFFSSSAGSLEAARATFERHARHSAAANAFLAYSLVVGQAEALEARAPEVTEAITGYCRRAEELDPVNPLAQAVLGHVYAFAFREFAKSSDHFDYAKQSGRNMALVWTFAAMHANYAGRYEAAYEYASRASQLGAFSPYRFLFDSGRVFSSTLSGRHTAAVRLGRDVLQRYPGFLGVKRYLSASLALNGHVDDARRLISDVRQRDPHFTSDGVAHPSYPLPGHRSVELVQSAFEATGMN